MLIKSIRLKNFRQYKAEQRPIVFSTDKERNVTVIIGVNTSGKTTLIQAFRWCLYGKCAFKENELLINKEVELSMPRDYSQEVSVEIVLIHEGREYTIKRTQIFAKTDTGKIKPEPAKLKVQYKEDNGEQQSVRENESQITVRKILPEELADYFFFDGERISDINNRTDVVNAVRGLMGLDVVSEAMEHLEPSRSASVISKFKAELDTGSDKDGARLKASLTAAQNKLAQLQERLGTTNTEIENLEQIKTDLSQQILAHAEQKRNQEKRAKLEKELAQIEKSIPELESQIVSGFTAGALRFFAAPLIKRALKVLEAGETIGEGIEGMRSVAIDHILARNRCICGCDLSKNEGARELIRYEQSLLPPQHLGTIIRNTKQKYEIYLEDNRFQSTVQQIHTNYRTNLNFIDDKTLELREISALIQEGGVDVARTETELQKTAQLLASKRSLRDNLMIQIGGVQKEIANTEANIAKLTLATEKNKKLYTYIAYAQAVYDWLKKDYARQEKEVKERLLASVNAIFEKMYHGKRKVSISDRYQITLLTAVGNDSVNIAESKGLEAVKNFSFIAGLVDLARQKMLTDNDTDTVPNSTEPYPLVMDAPFSNADEIHVKNISTILPEIAEQVILIVMNKDFEHARPAMADKLGKIYYIEKVNNSETNSVVREAE